MSSNPRTASRHVPPLNPKQSGRTLHTLEELVQQRLLQPEDLDDLQAVANRFAIAITPQMADLIDPTDPADPIAGQFVPDTSELRVSEQGLADPIGDQNHSPVKGIVHRYPDRLLLTPLRVCPVYCRFCFRRENVGNNAGKALSTDELRTAINYIRNHKDVWEVILSGGDPLLLAPRRLKHIITELENIEHVKVIRVHTRVPVVAPERISTELVNALKNSKAVYVVLHSNHVRELTHEAIDASARLVDNGIPMLSQTVLLKGINDTSHSLEELLRKLVEIRVKPYYLHHADRARGTEHFRTTVAEGQQIMRELRGRVSGICQPEYVLDIPGGAGKVPIAASWIEPLDDGSYCVSDYQGNPHQYTDNSPSGVDEIE